MPRILKASALGACICLACIGQATANNPFTEFFDAASPTAQWTITATGGTVSGWQQGGMHLVNDAGTFVATAPWAVGNSQFFMDVGFSVNNLLGKGIDPSNAVGMALTTAVPGSMGSSGASFVCVVSLAGIYCGMRSGELAGLSGSDLSGFTTQPNSQTFAWPQAPGGGAIPNQWLWWFDISRDGSNNLTVGVYTDHFQSGSSPFWTGTFAIPAGQQAKSFQDVSLLTFTTSGSSNFQADLKVTSIWGYTTITGGSAQTLTSTIPSGGSTTYQSGNTITLTGTNFNTGGGSTCALRVGSGTMLQTATPSFSTSTAGTLTLPTESNGVIYPSWLSCNGIYNRVLGGLQYNVGTLYSITPHEVPLSPASNADGTVQVYGCGVDATSTMTFAGNAGTVTYIDPCHLSVVVPSGTAGIPRIILKAASGVTTLYDSATSGTWPPQGQVNFGYAGHPYLNFTTVGTSGVTTLATLQAQWTNPAFADYVTALQDNLIGGTPNACCAALPAGSAGAGSFLDYGWAYILSGTGSYLISYNTALAANFVDQGATGATIYPVSPFLQSIVFSSGGFDFGLSLAGQVASFYDALFPSLTPTQRAQYLSYLDPVLAYFRQATQPAQDPNCGSSGASNRIAICAAGAGIVALAEINSVVTVEGWSTSTPWIAATGNSLVTTAIARLKSSGNNYMQTWLADGGNVEGSLYAGFGGTAYMAFAHAYFNTAQLLGLSSPSQMFTSVNIELLNSWVQSLWDGYVWATYDDTQPQWFNAALMAEVGNRQSLPALLYLADYLVSHNTAEMYSYPGHLGFQGNRYDYLPYAYMWRGSTSGTVPSWPTVQVNASVNQAALRSTANFNTEFYVGIKGKNGQELTGGGHTQPDACSFQVQSRGEEPLIDPGYNVSAANNHSLLSIDGTTPCGFVTCTAIFDATVTLNNANFRSVALDCSAAYGASVTALRRTFTMYNSGGNRFAVILDDVQATGAGSIISYFQSGQSTATASSGFTLTGTASKLLGVYSGPTVTVANSSQNLCTPNNSWVFCNLQTNYNRITASYTASALNPLITTLAPADLSGAGAMTASISRSVMNQISVTLSDGASMVFNFTGGVWKLTRTNPAPTHTNLNGSIVVSGGISIQ